MVTCLAEPSLSLSVGRPPPSSLPHCAQLRPCESAASAWLRPLSPSMQRPRPRSGASTTPGGPRGGSPPHTKPLGGRADHPERLHSGMLAGDTGASGPCAHISIAPTSGNRNGSTEETHASSRPTTHASIKTDKRLLDFWHPCATARVCLRAPNCNMEGSLQGLSVSPISTQPGYRTMDAEVSTLMTSWGV